MTAVERIKAEELTMEARLRKFQDAAESADDYLMITEAWWQYADGLEGWWRSRAQDVFESNIKRVGTSLI